MPVKKTIDHQAIAEAIDRLADAIAAEHAASENLVLAGIANGGIPLCEVLCEALAKRIGTKIPKAVIDISFHRDDIGQKPITKEVQGTQMAHDPEDATIILVDDVLFSGRTVRAAIAEVLTLGRPYRIELAVLVDRGNRRLPIQANFTGMRIDATPEEKVRVRIDPSDPTQSRVDVEPA